MNREDVTRIVLEQIQFLVRESNAGYNGSPQDNIRDIGLDSLDVVELLMEVEDEYGINIPDDAIANCVTIDDVIDVVMHIGSK